METKPVVKTLAERLAKNRNRDSEREIGKWTLFELFDALPHMPSAIKADIFLEGSGRCGGQGWQAALHPNFGGV